MSTVTIPTNTIALHFTTYTIVVSYVKINVTFCDNVSYIVRSVYLNDRTFITMERLRKINLYLSAVIYLLMIIG